MSEVPPSAPGADPESMAQMSKGRLVSVVHIMRGRHSIRSNLGVLELDHGSLSLRNAKGSLLFSVPAASVEARPRRRIAVYPTFFEVRAADRWWNLAAWAPTKHRRRSTRELLERSELREPLQRPPGLSEDDYQLLMRNPVRLQILWKERWLAVLGSSPQA
ncbi:MAG: hypothetical protein J2O38_06620 [Acidimicrobiales bacterium]|nr:hypothetical protein [Acidimicrobiales bacterium]